HRGAEGEAWVRTLVVPSLDDPGSLGLSDKPDPLPDDDELSGKDFSKEAGFVLMDDILRDDVRRQRVAGKISGDTPDKIPHERNIVKEWTWSTRFMLGFGFKT